MRPTAVPLILAAALAGTAASAQSTDPYAGYGTAPPAAGYGQQGYPPPGYGDGQGDGYGDPGQPPAYGNAPPPPGGVRYRDDERWSGQDSDSSADARGEADGAHPGYPPRDGAQSPRTRAYAARVAQWRARADACEAGDLRACQGPDD